ncbi:prephenate/arogenate dehydrogenase family protein [Brucella abortus]|nr:prephenate/arogenate dehydrogenase family protein [Brucella abortus]
MSTIHFDKITLIGIGLIGSSLARVIRREGLATHIAIATRSAETLKRAEELNLGDSYTTNSAEAVKDADLVIVSVPVGSSGTVARQIAGNLKPGAIVTDVGSTKASVIAQMQPELPENVHFIPGHPLAGTEYSGPDAGFAELFTNRWCILTPLPDTDEKALEKLTAFWTACGSRLDHMDPQHHDLVLAIVSHLPHIIAYNIVGTASDLELVTKSEVIKYSASGFRDFTRLAASDPTMWRDVCLHNKDAILEMLGRFSEDLASLQRSIRWGDGEALFDLFTRTRAVHRGIIDAGQEVDAPDFGRQAAVRSTAPLKAPEERPSGIKPALALPLRMAISIVGLPFSSFGMAESAKRTVAILPPCAGNTACPACASDCALTSVSFRSALINPSSLTENGPVSETIAPLGMETNA